MGFLPSCFLQKASIWSKKNAGVLERAQQDLEAKREEEDVMGRSKYGSIYSMKAYKKLFVSCNPTLRSFYSKKSLP